MIRMRKSKRGWLEVDISVRLPTGETIRERVKSPVTGRAASERWARERESQILAQGGRRPKEAAEERPCVTLKEFKDRFVREHLTAEQRKPSSIDAYESLYRTHIDGPLGSKRLDEITLSDIQSLKAGLLEGRSAKTVNNVLSALGSMFRRAVEWQVIESFPRFKLIKTMKPAITFYDFSEYARLVEAARALDPRIEALMLLAGDAGLRRGEILALEWTDLDFVRRQIHIQRSEWKGLVTAPKGGRARVIPMTDALFRALQAVRHLRGPRVLYRDGGERLTNKVVRLWILAAQRRAGLPMKNGGIHFLRHTFCSHLAMRGAPARAIQELAGHSTLSMTQRYMHLSPAAKDSAIRLLDRRPAADGDMMETTSPGGTKPSEIR